MKVTWDCQEHDLKLVRNDTMARLECPAPGCGNIIPDEFSAELDAAGIAEWDGRPKDDNAPGQPQEIAVVIYDRQGKRGGQVPQLVHADGTNCAHTGRPRPITQPGEVPACGAGQPVTHVRFDGRLLTLEQVYRSLKNIAEAWTRLITPSITVLCATAGPLLDGDPNIRALAAATAALGDERRQLT